MLCLGVAGRACLELAVRGVTAAAWLAAAIVVTVLGVKVGGGGVR